MTDSTVISNTDQRGVTRIFLNRPRKRNAFDDQLIIQLSDALQQAGQDPKCRVVILGGEGKHFSAGADLEYMKRSAELTAEQNIAEARRLAGLMRLLDELPRPTVCRVQGAAFGGALGLICASDVVVGSNSSRYCLSEARLGLTPAAISPYVARTIGQRQARRYFQTAEEMTAERALALGLIHERVAEEDLDKTVEEITAQLLRNGPQAMAAGKELAMLVSGGPVEPELEAHTARVIARLRTSAEGQEGLSAYFEKRAPSWAVSDD